ncbi:fibropellin-1, partial [Nephila pilipes]
MVVKMLFCVTFSALVLVSSAFFLKNEHPTKEIGFNQSHSQGVGLNFFANIADAEACSCKNGRCVKDNKGNWKCLCNPRHSMQGTDCAECYCGKKGKCIFTETFNKETLNVQYEKKCVCDSGYADKNGICV